LWGAAALLCAGAANAAEDWLLVASTPDHEPVYVSKASLKLKERVYTFWQKAELKNGNSVFSRISIDCADDTWAILSAQIRDAKGYSLHTDNLPQPFTAIPPESVVDSISLAICQEKSSSYK
jgi:hypothetical protein